MQGPAILPRIAAFIAFVLAAGAIVSAATGFIVLLPFALIPLLGGIGILRNRQWSAYGLALYFCAQVVPVSLTLLREGTPPAGAGSTVASLALSLLLACLFLLAGKSLARTGAPRGSAISWIAMAAMVSLPFLFVQPFVIPTGAMENTILIGDGILVQRFPKPTATRGDLVVFVYPIDRRQSFVKRIVGVPGDRIRISNKLVYRNGTAIPEPFAAHKTDYEDTYRDNFPSEPNVQLAAPARDMLSRNVVNGEVVVPDGCYFVLGDNRDHSLDSRYWGFVHANDLVGKPLLIYDSRDRPADAASNGNPFPMYRVRWERLLKRL